MSVSSQYAFTARMLVLCDVAFDQQGKACKAVPDEGYVRRLRVETDTGYLAHTGLDEQLRLGL